MLVSFFAFAAFFAHLLSSTQHLQDWLPTLDLLGQLHLSYDVDLPDCLIAATALRLNLAVVTINDRHFRLFKGLKVLRPY